MFGQLSMFTSKLKIDWPPLYNSAIKSGCKRLAFAAAMVQGRRRLTRRDLTTSWTTRMALDGNSWTSEFGCDVRVFHAVVSCN